MTARRWFLRPALWWVILFAWVALLWWLSSQPGSGNMPRIPHLDKILHTTYFFCGGIALQVALRCSGFKLSTSGFLIAGLLFAALIGALDEHHQTFTPGRTGHDVFDWLADCLGGTLAALAAGRILQNTSLFKPKA